jgi:hypothetical protein
MLRRHFISAWLCTGLIACRLALGPAIAADDCTPGTVVLHVNGIWAENGSFANAQYLERVINVRQTQDLKPVVYRFFPNPSNNVQDLVESALAWAGADVSRNNLLRFAHSLGIAVAAGSIQAFLTSVAPELGPTLTQAIRNELVQIFADKMKQQVLDARATNGSATADLTATIKTYVDQGYRVIVVPHSQGNWYTNKALMTLSATQQQATVNVGVATPDDTVFRGGPTVKYAKLPLDLVVRALGLPPNASQSGICSDLVGHSFGACYLSGFSPDARSKIIQGVTDGFSVPLPSAIIGVGQLVATLSWGSQPDVDLHAFEPNGAHVYYGNRTGPMGTLDRDDTDGLGPENYKVCQANEANIQTGQYRIGVNYFSGSAPETAKINVKAGTVTRAFSVALPTARGSAGNSTPIPVSTVVVSRGQNNALLYQIQ